MKEALAITGCSVVTPLDNAFDGVGGTWAAIRAGRRVGVENWVREGLLEGEAGLDRSVRLGLAAARRLEGGGARLEGARLFCGTSKGPMGVYLGALDRLRKGGGEEGLTEMEARHVLAGTGAMGEFLRERLGLADGVVHTSVAACSSGLHALHRAAMAIREGECERAVVVASDASLHAMFEGSFARLGVLAPVGADGVRRCEPFGEGGEGFFLVEAAAAVVLEAARGLGGRKPLAWLEESWIGGDGTALIAVDERTEGLRVGLRACGGGGGGGGLAFVHAHATGTGHDAHELAAIRAVAGEEVEIFSHKKWLGHSLGAAGLVSVVLSVMSHERGETLVGTRVAAGGRSLTVGQGFGGHIGVVGLRGV